MKAKPGKDKQITSKNKSATIRRRKKNLVITIPLRDEPRPSKSGKSLLIATTRGVRKSRLKHDGQSVLFVANVFYYPVAKSQSASSSAKKRSKKRVTEPTKLRRRQDLRLLS